MNSFLALVGGGMVMSSALMLAGGARRPRRGVSQPAGPAKSRAAPALPGRMTETDIGLCCADVMREAEGAAERDAVSLRFAAAPGISLRVDPDGLRHAVSEMLGAAIAAAPCGTVLLSVARHGGRVAVAVTDDGTPAPRDRRAAALSRVADIAAWHGATLEIEPRGRAGTTTVLRLLDRVAVPKSLPEPTKAVEVTPIKERAPAMV